MGICLVVELDISICQYMSACDILKGLHPSLKVAIAYLLAIFAGSYIDLPLLHTPNPES